MYICRFELPRNQRHKRPELVDARHIHDWVMRKRRNDLGAEDEEGIRKFRELKCNLGDADAVRSVQRMFIEVRRLRKLYRMKTKEKTIIGWLLRNIEPKPVKQTVYGILQQRTHTGIRASKRLSSFHKLLMDIARTFAKSLQLGLLRRHVSARNRPQRGRKNNTGSGHNFGSKTPQRQSRAKNRKNGRQEKLNKRGERVSCFWCGGNHYVSKCPTCPQEKKEWTMHQWFDHNKASNGHRIREPGKKSNASKAPNSGGGKPWARNPRHPPGYAKRKLTNSTGPGKAEREKPKMEDTPGVKRALSQNSTASRRRKRPSKPGKIGKNDVADGLARVGGLQCHYICDGGCDRATVSHILAQRFRAENGPL